MKAIKHINYLIIALAIFAFLSGYKLPSIFFTRLDPIHFFPKLCETKNNLHINFPEAVKIEQIHSPTNIVNEHPKNFYATCDLSNLKFHIIEEDWAKDLSTTPAFDAENIFTLKNSGHIKCYNKFTKVLNWQYKIILPSKEHKFSTVSIQGQYLIVTVKNMLFVCDKSNGHEILLKIVETPIISSPPLDKNGILHVQTSDIYYQFDMNHKRELNRKYGCHAKVVQQNTIAPVLYKDGTLTTHADNKITYNPCDINDPVASFRLPSIISDMELLRSKLPSKLRSVACQTIIAGDSLFVSSTHTKVMQYNLKNQGIAWQVNIPGVMQILKVKNTIFSIGYANQIIAINADSGKILWVKNLPYEKSDAFLTLSMVNGKILLCSKEHKSITIVGSDGTIEKQIMLPKLPVKSQILSIMPVNDELILFTSKKAIKLL